MTNQIQWTNALSTRASLEAAVEEVVNSVKQRLSTEPNLGIVFISSAYASEYPRLVPLLLEKMPLPVLIGCGGGGIVGITQEDKVCEVEGNPALSLSVTYLPDVEIIPFHISAEEIPDLDSPPQAWLDLLGVSPQQKPQFVLLSDPFSSKINDLLEGLDFAYPDAVKVGGLASVSTMNVQNGLFCYSQAHSSPYLYREGTVGVALCGKIILETIVAQGCRPIGEPYLVSGGERNVILELTEINNDSQEKVSAPPLAVLQNIVQTLSESDQQLAQHSLFIGVARDEFKRSLQQGDFLIRNLIGVDPNLGAIAIGDRVRPGGRIQFHLRDSRTSAEDLQLLLDAYQSEHDHTFEPQGALMFSCLGRGKSLYDLANFDSDLFRSRFSNISLGGFFCNGEIGPVGGRTFLHGYTAAFAIFRQPDEEDI